MKTPAYNPKTTRPATFAHIVGRGVRETVEEILTREEPGTDFYAARLYGKNGKPYRVQVSEDREAGAYEHDRTGTVEGPGE
jgi:hypothetical protein